MCFFLLLGRKSSLGGVVDQYYHYQSIYLRLIAKNQWNEALNSAVTKNQITTGIQEMGQQKKKNIIFEPQHGIDSTHQSSKISNFELNLVQEKKEQKNEKNSESANYGVLNLKDNFGYSCPRCGNTYTRTHSLNRHIRFECGIEPKFVCPICHKKSKHKHNLLIHMRTHHKH